jgi:putative ABC transport system permease protein
MLKNYFRTAWRNLAKNKSQSTINIVGLSVGMAVVMLIGFWIWDEMSFDHDNQNINAIAQVKQNLSNNGQIDTWDAVPFPLAADLRKNFGGDFKYIVLSTGTGDHILSVNDKLFTSAGVFAEPDISNLLSLKMIRGSRNALRNPASLFLSRSTAKTFFGNADPINQVIKIDNKQIATVAGIYEDFPKNSTFARLSFVAPWDLYFPGSWASTAEDPWRPNAFTILVQIADQADMARVSFKIKDAKLIKVNKRLATHKPQLFLHPMNRWHLYDEFKNGVNTGGRIQYVWMFGIIGVFVLLLACINFMNLSTARSEKRAKEVGIRKAIGSKRAQLIFQFFSESLLIVAFAFVLSLLWVALSIPFFNRVAGKQMSILWDKPAFWLMGLGFTLMTGLVAGCYPALYLSSFQAVKVLKGTFKVGRLALVPRKVLVVIQFCVSIVLIIGTGVVFRQIQFAKDRPVGYQRNGLIAIPVMTENIHNHFDAIRNELRSSGSITELAESQSPTTGIYNSTSGLDWKGKDPNLAVDFPVVNASIDYGKTVGFELLDGRGFSRDFLGDSSAIILSQAAVGYMGLKHPVGEILTWNGQNCTVIGVVKDMLSESPYAEPRPTIYGLADQPGNFVLAKINPAKSASVAVQTLETVFKKYNPDQPFDFKFVDEEYATKFGNEERIGRLAASFSILAIFISCLGLFGMASFMAEQRVKEIGVRKVLGASVFNLWRLLSKDFVRLVFISIIIAIPLAYYFMFHWLMNFSYKTTLNWWIFAGAALGALVITLCTVSFQSIKAAVANPVRSLRNE